MKKIIGIILFVLFSGVSYLLTFIDINKFENVYDIAFTYLSITIGFIVTSITIIASSGFSKVLYSKQDPRNNSRTLLHNLLWKFESTLILYSIPMILILVSPIIMWNPKYEICQKLFNAGLLVLTISTFPVLVNQFRVMLKFIIQNVKNLP